MTTRDSAIVGAIFGAITGAIVYFAFVQWFFSLGRMELGGAIVLSLVGAVFAFIPGMLGGIVFGSLGGKLSNNWAHISSIIGGIVSGVFTALACGFISYMLWFTYIWQPSYGR